MCLYTNILQKELNFSPKTKFFSKIEVQTFLSRNPLFRCMAFQVCHLREVHDPRSLGQRSPCPWQNLSQSECTMKQTKRDELPPGVIFDIAIQKSNKPFIFSLGKVNSLSKKNTVASGPVSLLWRRKSMKQTNKRRLKNGTKKSRLTNLSNSCLASSLWPLLR